MSETVKNRYEFVYLFDVENGNPNGDPDAGNMPRIDPETSYGLVTDVCIKRKIRNYVQTVKGEHSPWEIYVKEKAVLTQVQGRAHQAVQAEGGKDSAKTVDLARKWMCQNFFDVRTFGAVMMLKENNCGQVRGPVQLNFARSLDPIVPLEVTITRMAVATEKEAKDQGGDNRTMGRKHIVPYGLYRCEGYVSASLAAQTGFSEEDLAQLWDALKNMFDHDHSAARGKMNARKLVVFRHETALGNAPAQLLFDRVTVRRLDLDKPVRRYADYAVSVEQDGLPTGITVLDLL